MVTIKILSAARGLPVSKRRSMQLCLCLCSLLQAYTHPLLDSQQHLQGGVFLFA
ncbi:hypothetical protein DUNSADRAFT_4908 [Dunaliella salina]|uniref:Uncharacterized protein n=1 Tax=Dunaliella salina TaxID=3046 RepID=A0ABQ7FUL5_DUNSA|nr:hypothetical protein DUNSADRAFT_4908 [Dunaliella salina]|eukprot:KAF5826089.1 hypothetical protein DUNSADRAFT_4908 [Dunaliella salina]